MDINPSFWKNKKILVTGHTGFKGSWLCSWLLQMGAKVYGYSLAPNPSQTLYETLDLDNRLHSTIADICHPKTLNECLKQSEAEIVFHLAAQSLVLESYKTPVETYQTNLIGTVNLLEACRHSPNTKAVVVITTDKCYENIETGKAYQESDPLGGHDPYSNSKACAELAVSAYRNSFFIPEAGANVASARAGNVIGGGDWSENRLVPDLIRSFANRQTAIIRNPDSVRPWQHVLEPLYGYLLLAENLFLDNEMAQAWNFGPADEACKPVAYIADTLKKYWGENANWEHQKTEQAHEAKLLNLDSSKAVNKLGWQPRFTIEQALAFSCEWYKAANQGENMIDVTQQQIQRYMNL